MEPIEHSYQQEWRIVHPMPLYGYKEKKQKIIANASPPKGWGKFMHVLTLTPSDVIGFVCPEKDKEIFQRALNHSYREKQIYTFQI